MDLEPQNLGNLLASYVNAQQAKECERLMDKLQSILTAEIPQNTLGERLIVSIYKL